MIIMEAEEGGNEPEFTGGNASTGEGRGGVRWSCKKGEGWRQVEVQVG